MLILEAILWSASELLIRPHCKLKITMMSDCHATLNKHRIPSYVPALLLLPPHSVYWSSLAGGSMETEDEWADRMWREMQEKRRRKAAADASESRRGTSQFDVFTDSGEMQKKRRQTAAAGASSCAGK